MNAPTRAMRTNLHEQKKQAKETLNELLFFVELCMYLFLSKKKKERKKKKATGVPTGHLGGDGDAASKP